jgi:hypothetical protein
MAIRKLNDIAAALSGKRICFMLLKKTDPISYTEAPFAPGISILFKREKKGSSGRLALFLVVVTVEWIYSLTVLPV